MRTLLVLLACLLAAPAFAQSPPPAALYGAYLSSVELREVSSGETYLQFQPSTFVFLPERQGTVDLLRDSVTVATFDWASNAGRAPFYEVGRPVLQSGASPYGYEIEQPGAYDLVYKIDGDAFWRFPFQVTAQTSGDPYNPGTTYRLEGPWRDHAYVLYAPDDRGRWDFKFWLHPDDYDASGNGYVTVTPTGGASPVLFGGSPTQPMGAINSANWARKEFRLKRPVQRTSDGRWFTGRDYQHDAAPLADGAYTLTLHLSDEPVRRYPFTVRDGEIVPTGLQAPGADPLDRIDGGGAAVWLFRDGEGVDG